MIHDLLFGLVLIDAGKHKSLKLATKMGRQRVIVTRNTIFFVLTVNVKINISFCLGAPCECLHGRRPISAVFGAGN